MLYIQISSTVKLVEEKQETKESVKSTSCVTLSCACFTRNNFFLLIQHSITSDGWRLNINSAVTCKLTGLVVHMQVYIKKGRGLCSCNHMRKGSNMSILLCM